MLLFVMRLVIANRHSRVLDQLQLAQRGIAHITFEEALIRHYSPTLAGVKPASLFRFCSRGDALFVRRFPALRQQFAARGLRLVILKGCRRMGPCLFCLYRKRDLAEVLGHREHRDFLRAMGYTPWEAPGGCLRQLTARLYLEEEFPHKIGVFLDYPLDDVKGLTHHKGRDYTFYGCWRCCGGPQAVHRRFECYRRCITVFHRRCAEGTSITQLTMVA